MWCTVCNTECTVHYYTYNLVCAGYNLAHLRICKWSLGFSSVSFIIIITSVSLIHFSHWLCDLCDIASVTLHLWHFCLSFWQEFSQSSMIFSSSGLVVTNWGLTETPAVTLHVSSISAARLLDQIFKLGIPDKTGSDFFKKCLVAAFKDICLKMRMQLPTF